MRERKDGFAEFLEAFPEAVIIHDGETIEHVNRAGLGMFGADSIARMVGMHVAGFLKPDCRQAFSGQVKVTGAADRPMKQKLLRLDGSPFHAEVTGGSFILLLANKRIQMTE